ncbi:DUF421 domain-containing protein [Achromobacter sp. ACM04]|uniref:DUF421 domain-containing protein n=1 Tax=Achromobacter aegrifaciens TaxID=1287736 RepID=A0ABU2D914_ACHAE|nr:MULTISPECIES: YetF domain-containing protein [Achromobacter]PTN50224.1 DUF421 domain-containing protein [Achromobacter xylosoxidans]MBD9384915.1 DUF421 domain-containing protein [Achromobacter sp. ACM02]MBD9423314.1 DUF421 domain-containing protein [Achromobacter sp. ACM04]MBD9432715.1 DUF421 domain-containing protein [Achromobacter sp. ACM03]MDQ1761791.1 DUF421 domain-containing protein [Achromobacter aegrifaciens]
MEKFAQIFELQAGFAEMIIRGTTMYWVLYALLRISGRRDMGSLGMADMLVLVLVADAAGNAMSGDSYSMGDGIIVVATIVGWSYLLDRVGYYVPPLRRLLEPQRVCLIRSGKVLVHGLRKEHITRSELMEQLRLKGVANLAEVERAYLEATGEFSVVRVQERSKAGASTLEDDDACG